MMMHIRSFKIEICVPGDSDLRFTEKIKKGQVIASVYMQPEDVRYCGKLFISASASKAPIDRERQTHYQISRD